MSRHYTACEECGGMGVDAAAEPAVLCPVCRGTGMSTELDGAVDAVLDCLHRGGLAATRTDVARMIRTRGVKGTMAHVARLLADGQPLCL